MHYLAPNTPKKWHRIPAIVAACLVATTAGAGPASADPSTDAAIAPVAAYSDATDAPPPPPPGAMPSATPGVLTTPDGWVLNVVGKDESLAPVAPLTGAPTSREYLVDGTFTGSITGSGSTALAGGTLEAGYQIGCGIAQDDIESITGGGISPFITPPFGFNSGLRPEFHITIGVTANLSQQMKIDLKPGTVNIVPVGKKSFKGENPRVSITGFRIKIDGCAGQSFIRSYATLTSSTDNTDDVITYLGVTKAV